MADGPRCKRRKQANPKRSSVTNVNGGLEASSSDSDDDDKLHIVEDESPPDAEESAVARGDSRDAKNATDANNTVLTHNGAWNGVKEECASKEEEEEEEDEDEEDGKGGERRGDVEPQRGMKKELAVEELLQKGDTAVIYPEAPDDQQSPAETAGVDENGTPDGLQLHTCPYCSRGYKRNASLKEHIKYRHETSEDNYRCSHCSYTFTYRSQLERHMSHHRGSKEQGRHVQPSGGGGGSGGGARKFKCTECFKAFKYKHHLKEHLRIHSGEKPYECANCKKRFSHSGSYSSHISSKKCVSVASAPNGLSRKSVKPLPSSADIPGVAVASGRMVLKEKPESKPLQEQLPVTQIKSEATELPCKPAVAAAPSANGAAPQPQSLSQGVAMVLPTVGLVPPININLSDLQNVLKLALDGNVLRQVLGTANGATVQGKPGIVVQQPQQQIISLPAFVDHDGTTKIIINYSIGPAPATTAATTATTTQPMPLFVKNNLVPAAPIPTKTDKPPTPKVDLSLVKEEPEESVLITETKTDQVKSIKTEDAEVLPPDTGSSTCSLCDECPENLEALHLLQHHKAANGEAVDSAALDPSFAALLSDAGVTLAQEPAVDDLLTLLKTYFASNANPDQEELEKLSDSVRIPVNVVRKWFAKMNSGKKICQDEELSKKTEPLNCESEATKQVSCQSPSDSPSLNTSDLVIIKSEPEDPETLDSQAEPLDLSLPKQVPTPTSAAPPEDTPTSKKPQQPVSLACLRKEQVGGRTIYVATPQTHRTAVNIVPTSQLPTLVAITGQGPVGCLGTIGGSAKRTILIPQLTYTYAHSAGTAAKTVVLNGHKTPETSSDGAAEEQREMSVMKKPRLENGVYSCDLCNKAFQKGSSLLRHKYEHTGKRPHECPVCHKAFKHKHHLIEHSRLHSGEKPYQCNKCGKRFSHSGSYSQHMNHRYSYCKRDGSDYGSSPDADATPATVDAGSPSAALDSDVGESEDDDEAMCVDDIRVVQVDDGECEIYEGNFDDDDDDDEDDGDDEEEDNVEKGVEKEEAHEEEKEKNLDVDEFACQVVEVELKDEQTPESAVEDKADKAEAAGVNLEQMADCTYKRIRDWSDSEESSDDQAVTDSK